MDKWFIKKAVWLSGFLGRDCSGWVLIPPWPQAEVILGSPDQAQLLMLVITEVKLPPVGWYSSLLTLSLSTLSPSTPIFGKIICLHNF